MAEPQIDDPQEERIDTESEETFKALTGTEKSAILMMLLGEEEGAAVMKALSPQEVQTLGAAMYSVQGVNQAIVNMVLDEFLDVIKQQTSLGLGRKLHPKCCGSSCDKAQSVLSRITPSSSEKPIEILDWMDTAPSRSLFKMSTLRYGISYELSEVGRCRCLVAARENLQSEVIQRIATLRP